MVLCIRFHDARNSQQLFSAADGTLVDAAAPGCNIALGSRNTVASNHALQVCRGTTDSAKRQVVASPRFLISVAAVGFRCDFLSRRTSGCSSTAPNTVSADHPGNLVDAGNAYPDVRAALVMITPTAGFALAHRRNTHPTCFFALPLCKSVNPSTACSRQINRRASASNVAESLRRRRFILFLVPP